MSLLDFLDRIFGGEDEVNLKTCSINTEENIYYKTLVLEASIDLIARALARAEFKTFENGKQVKKLNYYLFNVEANKNTSAFVFWKETIKKLLRNGGALVLLQDSQMYLADSFTREEYAFLENKYSDITIGDYSLTDTWYESQVLYFKYDNEKIRAAIDGIYKDFMKLITASIKGYQNSKARKGKLKIPTSLPKGLDGEKELQKYIQETMRDFMDPGKDAVYPESSGFEYTELYEAKVSRSNDSGRETKNLVYDIFDFIAIAFGIPPSVLKGDMVNTKDAVNNFLAFCINPIAKLIENEINRKMYGYKHFSKRNYMKVDTTTIKVTDLKDIASSIDILNRNAALTIDDILEILGKEPVGGEIGSMRFITKNYELLDKVLKEGSVNNYSGGGG